MPSPFPGMDPYLEHPLRWPGVHNTLISTLREELIKQLRPHYIVETELRVYISQDDDPGRAVILPDLHIVSNKRAKLRPISQINNWEDSSVAVAEPIDAITLIDEEIRETYISIIDALDHRLITSIEILSPTNKVPNSEGRLSYMGKRRQIMLSDVSLVEIDLLREGERIPTGRGIIPCDYMVHVSRAGKRPGGQIWPIKLRERLPVIPVPLKKGDADARLDLQELITTMYDRGGYDYSLDYRKEPVPGLPRKEALWAAKTVKAILPKREKE